MAAKPKPAKPKAGKLDSTGKNTKLQKNPGAKGGK